MSVSYSISNKQNTAEQNHRELGWGIHMPVTKN